MTHRRILGLVAVALFAVSASNCRLFDALTGSDEPPPSQFGGRAVIFDYRALLAVDDRIVASSMYGWLIAYDPATGSELWRVDPETSDGNGNPIYADATSIYVTFLEGVVVTLAMKDGHVRAHANKTELVASIALGSDRFYAPGDHGLYAYAKR
jgi:outer membrane protein assembly factor BamB